MFYLFDSLIQSVIIPAKCPQPQSSIVALPRQLTPCQKGNFANAQWSHRNLVWHTPLDIEGPNLNWSQIHSLLCPWPLQWVISEPQNKPWANGTSPDYDNKSNPSCNSSWLVVKHPPGCFLWSSLLLCGTKGSHHELCKWVIPLWPVVQWGTPSLLCSSWSRPHYTTEDSGITLPYKTCGKDIFLSSLISYFMSADGTSFSWWTSRVKLQSITAILLTN